LAALQRTVGNQAVLQLVRDVTGPPAIVQRHSVQKAWDAALRKMDRDQRAIAARDYTSSVEVINALVKKYE
jgi:hypothetical protein